MKLRNTPPTKGLVAVAHHRLVRFSSFFWSYIEEGFEVFSVSVHEAEHHQRSEANGKCHSHQIVEQLKDDLRLAASSFCVVLHLDHDGLVCRSRCEMEKYSSDRTDSEPDPSDLEYPNVRGTGTQQRSSECNRKSQRTCGHSNYSINEDHSGCKLLLRKFTNLSPCALCIHDFLANV
jgi:hypothetical protein